VFRVGRLGMEGRVRFSLAVVRDMGIRQQIGLRGRIRLEGVFIVQQRVSIGKKGWRAMRPRERRYGSAVSDRLVWFRVERLAVWTAVLAGFTQGGRSSIRDDRGDTRTLPTTPISGN
jgi:hypothetical protein